MEFHLTDFVLKRGMDCGVDIQTKKRKKKSKTIYHFLRDINPISEDLGPIFVLTLVYPKGNGEETSLVSGPRSQSWGYNSSITIRYSGGGFFKDEKKRKDNW